MRGVLSNSQLRYITAWLWAGFGLVLAMVVVGGITRLTGSGLSMVEWKPVTGAIPPLNEQDWLQEFEKYKTSPQFVKVNFWMDLAAFKQIYWWEFIHRLLGRVIGVVFIIPFIFFYVKKWLSPALLKRLLIIFLLGGLQGVVGWLMVWSGLQHQPHVSHFRLAAHLFMALLLLSVILWTILELQSPLDAKAKSNKKLFWIYACLSILFIQIIAGAFVAGLRAGFSYNTFPLMEGGFFPPIAVVKSSSLLYNGVVLQFIHRWLAFVALFAALVLYMHSKANPITKPFALWLLILTVAQITLGVFTLVFYVPVVLGVLHQVVAIILFTVALTVLFNLRHDRVLIDSKV